MRPGQFERVVREALAEVPPEWARLLREVPILVEDEPDPAQAGGDELFGLFEGASLAERSAGYGYDPPRITIYRKPLERAFRGRERLRREIRRTVLHEIMHYVGGEECDMGRFGLE